MNKSFQQIMIGTLTKNFDSALCLLKHLKEIGYDEIELNSFMITPSSFLVRMLTSLGGMPTGNSGKLDWNKLISLSGLKVTSLHSDIGSLEKDAAAVIERAKSFNTDKIVITGLYRFAYDDIKSLDELCSRLNTIGKKLSDQGISLLYHNHNVEFRRLDTGEYIYEYLINHTQKEYVNFEFDSYWCCDSGANPLSIMNLLGERMKLYHITDRGYRAKGPFMTPLLKDADTMELGTGSMDLLPLISKAKENGVTSIILETHRNFIDKSPLKSLELSVEYLKKNGEL